MLRPGRLDLMFVVRWLFVYVTEVIENKFFLPKNTNKRNKP